MYKFINNYQAVNTTLINELNEGSLTTDACLVNLAFDQNHALHSKELYEKRKLNPKVKFLNLFEILLEHNNQDTPLANTAPSTEIKPNKIKFNRSNNSYRYELEPSTKTVIDNNLIESTERRKVALEVIHKEGTISKARSIPFNAVNNFPSFNLHYSPLGNLVRQDNFDMVSHKLISSYYFDIHGKLRCIEEYFNGLKNQTVSNILLFKYGHPSQWFSTRHALALAILN